MEKEIKQVDKDLLNEISNLENIEKGAYNIRKNGQGIERKITEMCRDYHRAKNRKEKKMLRCYLKLGTAEQKRREKKIGL